MHTLMTVAESQYGPESEYEISGDGRELRIRVRGRTLEDVFLHALHAVTTCMKPGLKEIAKKGKKVSQTIVVEAVDINSLLLQFLSEVVSSAVSQGAAFSAVAFKQFGENFLEGRMSGVTVEGFDRDIQGIDDVADVRKNTTTGYYETEVQLSV